MRGVLFLCVLSFASSFTNYNGTPTHKQKQKRGRFLTKKQLKTNNESPSVEPENTLDAFDFASKKGWDDFYSRDIPFAFEWHSSIPHEAILSEVGTTGSSVLMVGTGNSILPRLLYDAHKGQISLTCLDYSQPCLNMLKKMHAESCPKMKFICGDARELEQIFDKHIHDPHKHHGKEGKGSVTTNEPFVFDTIIDKGLVDAFMCGEGWNGDVELYMKGVATILEDRIGRFILISYKLTSSTKFFLTEVGLNNGLEWEFDIPSKSNSRVSFSVAHKLGLN